MAREKEGLSIIDKDCSVEGIVNVSGKLIIAGSVKGTLLGNTVITASGSRVNAVARVREMTIGGAFKGDITVYEDLQILSTGAFSGKATCKRMKLETGGKLDGKVTHLEPAEVASGMERAGCDAGPGKAKEERRGGGSN
jgi:cytoskeletal protein CcmA (bactofilin family)